MTAFGLFYENLDVINELTTALQGQYFCANPDVGFTEDEIELCIQNMSIFMPPALKLIGSTVIVFNNEICNQWYEEVCPAT